MKYPNNQYTEAALIFLAGVAVILAVLLIPGCAHVNRGPAVDVCVFSASDATMYCADKFGQSYNKSFADAEGAGFVCMPPTDFEGMITFYKTGVYPSQVTH